MSKPKNIEDWTPPKLGETAREAADIISSGGSTGTYGEPVEEYSKVAALFKILTGIELSVSQALTFMQCVKLAREATKHKEDNLVDLCGYTDMKNYAEGVAQERGGDLTIEEVTAYEVVRREALTRLDKQVEGAILEDVDTAYEKEHLAAFEKARERALKPGCCSAGAPHEFTDKLPSYCIFCGLPYRKYLVQRRKG